MRSCIAHVLKYTLRMLHMYARTQVGSSSSSSSNSVLSLSRYDSRVQRFRSSPLGCKTCQSTVQYYHAVMPFRNSVGRPRPTKSSTRGRHGASQRTSLGSLRRRWRSVPSRSRPLSSRTRSITSHSARSMRCWDARWGAMLRPFQALVRAVLRLC